MIERYATLLLDYCLALHADAQLPVGQIHYTEGLAMANVDTVDLTITDKAGLMAMYSAAFAIMRRVSGYNLDQLLPENGFNVARALVGSEGHVLDANRALCAILHRGREQLVGITLDSLRHPDDVEASHSFVTAAVESGSAPGPGQGGGLLAQFPRPRDRARPLSHADKAGSDPTL